MNDDDPMPFGKHKGRKMSEVPARYLDWLRDQDWLAQWPDVRSYVEDNETVLDEELREQGIGPEE